MVRVSSDPFGDLPPGEAVERENSLVDCCRPGDLEFGPERQDSEDSLMRTLTDELAQELQT